MPLKQYRARRKFEETPEPRGGKTASAASLSFVVQKHAASRLHYDFRLQVGGVLASWAVPKGPSTTPGEKRLAVHVEDHPLEYGKFEGVIPKGHYGAGTVEIWDKGTWVPEGDPRRGLRAGNLKFTLKGKKLKGGWALVRMAPKANDKGDKENWLLIKHHGSEPSSAAEGPPAARRAPRSARHAVLPELLEPQLATLVAAPPAGDEWLHEIKFDGYRLLTRISDGHVRLFTRGGNDWTARFEGIARAAAGLKVQAAWLDGEVVAAGPDGRHSFQALQRALKERGGEPVYYVFDLLHLDGVNLTGVPLEERKQALARLLPSYGGVLRFSDHVSGGGVATFAEACRLRLEGIVSKRRDGAYHPGRGTEWRKSKCQSRQEFVIGGFTEPAGGRAGFGALLLGVWSDDGMLTYAGRVGTGFDHAGLLELHRKLAAREIRQPPFEDPPGGARNRHVHWVRPDLVGEVSFTEWTSEGHLRHPSFLGLRADRKSRDVRREKPAASEGPARPRGTEIEVAMPIQRQGRSVASSRAGDKARVATRALPARAAVRATAGAAPTHTGSVVLTHPERILYPGMGVTKADLAEFYRTIADFVVPQVARRPLALVRCPAGQGKACFYQKHLESGAPRTILSRSIEESSKTADYPWIKNVDGLVGLVQMGVLEVHPWGSRVDDVERPDRIIFDIDPDEGLPWAHVVVTATLVRRRLEELGLEAWLKSTGGKGVHVVVPIQRKYEWPVIKAFAHAVALDLARRHPAKILAVVSKARRKGLIFLDYLRNCRGATAVAAYSTRARPGAPVATPLAWDELARLGRADRYNVKNLPKRLATLKHDPWAGLAASRQSLTQRTLSALAID